jgi:hypothetical protein
MKERAMEAKREALTIYHKSQGLEVEKLQKNQSIS